jgi:uncharacterized protein DUF3291
MRCSPRTTRPGCPPPPGSWWSFLACSPPWWYSSDGGGSSEVAERPHCRETLGHTGEHAVGARAGQCAGLAVPLTAVFVYGEMHRQVMRRRCEWFQPMKEAYTACWWMPAGKHPTTDDAEDRIRHLRAHGPTSYAFTLRTSYPAPDTAQSNHVQGLDRWFCSV